MPLPAPEIAILAVTALGLWLLLGPRIHRHRFWRATVTPLASIIGSGFLIVAPLLAKIAGRYAVPAMLGIVVFAFFVGAAVRFNIRYAEPIEHDFRRYLWSLERGENPDQPPLDHLVGIFGRAANWALAVAYVISVAFYIRLMAAFVLYFTPFASSPGAADVLATAVLLGIALVGLIHGFRGLEWTEVIAVSIKLAIIAAMLFALLWRDAVTGAWASSAHPAPMPLVERLRLLAGMLLIVQGFETSRYLGDIYSPDERRRSMLLAQLIAAAIYIAFVVLLQPLLGLLPSGRISETAIITLSSHVSRVLPWLLVLAALMSQLSAAVADTAGAGGLVAEESGRLLPERGAYPLLIAAAIALIWSFDIFQVVAIASRAFAFYYMMEALIAWRVSGLVLPPGPGRRWRRTGFLLLALLLAAVTLFARAAESG